MLDFAVATANLIRTSFIKSVLASVARYANSNPNNRNANINDDNNPNNENNNLGVVRLIRVYWLYVDFSQPPSILPISAIFDCN